MESPLLLQKENSLPLISLRQPKLKKTSQIKKKLPLKWKSTTWKAPLTVPAAGLCYPNNGLPSNGQNISMPRVKLSLAPQFHYLTLWPPTTRRHVAPWDCDTCPKLAAKNEPQMGVYTHISEYITHRYIQWIPIWNLGKYIYESIFYWFFNSFFVFQWYFRIFIDISYFTAFFIK